MTHPSFFIRINRDVNNLVLGQITLCLTLHSFVSQFLVSRNMDNNKNEHLWVKRDVKSNGVFYIFNRWYCCQLLEEAGEFM